MTRRPHPGFKTAINSIFTFNLMRLKHEQKFGVISVYLILSEALTPVPP